MSEGLVRLVRRLLGRPQGITREEALNLAMDFCEERGLGRAPPQRSSGTLSDFRFAFGESRGGRFGVRVSRDGREVELGYVQRR